MANDKIIFDPLTQEIHLKAPPEVGGNLIWTEPGAVVSPTPTPSISVTPTITPTPSPTPARLQFEVDPNAVGSSALACAQTNFVADGFLEVGYSVPTVGAILYTTAGGSTGFGTACPNYVTLRYGGTKWACIIANGAGSGGEPCENPLGLIRTVVECVAPSPTPTPTVTPSISITPTPSISITPTPSISITPTPTPTPSNALSGPVACWTFDETSGTFFDSINSNDLTITNNINYGQEGKVGLSAGFQTSTSYARMADNSGLTGLTDQSFSFWIKFTGTTAQTRYVYRLTGPTNGGSIVWAAVDGTSISFAPWKSGSAYVYLASMDVSDGNWHHVAIAHNSSGLATSFWHNGTFVVTDTGAEGAVPVEGASTFNIGSYGGSGFNVYANLDSFTIWDRTLQSSEIPALYNSGSGIGC